MVVTSVNNDETVHPQMLLKIHKSQVYKFQNGYFKELWKAAPVLQKAYYLRVCYEICS